ncbi:MAG: hypothetical protein HGA38_05690 [Candidatus Moranbacteria bacterium]|nr:hypothetical protein [Candidatus Moranbacteria bacterium]NTW46419.1 hypothetical protein [Candidatus Moranbacteria bacterium]
MKNPSKGNLLLAASLLTTSLGSLAILFHAKQMLIMNGPVSFMEGLLLGLGGIETVFLNILSACFLAKHNIEQQKSACTF